MMKEIISADKLYRAIIIHRKDGLFEIDYFKRSKEIVPEFNFESHFFWEPFNSPSLAESLANAEKLGQEQIKAWEV
jgi:hypothetical protein